MGKASAAIIDFIKSIPDEKLTGFSDPNPSYTVYDTTDFRLDVQNVSESQSRRVSYTLKHRCNRKSYRRRLAIQQCTIFKFKSISKRE